jgi:hypothetical protein
MMMEGMPRANAILLLGSKPPLLLEVVERGYERHFCWSDINKTEVHSESQLWFI